MREITLEEIDCIDGGATGGTISVEYGAMVTVGLMAISMTPVVLGVGAAALVVYALL